MIQFCTYNCVHFHSLNFMGNVTDGWFSPIATVAVHQTVHPSCSSPGRPVLNHRNYLRLLATVQRTKRYFFAFLQAMVRRLSMPNRIDKSWTKFAWWRALYGRGWGRSFTVDIARRSKPIFSDVRRTQPVLVAENWWDFTIGQFERGVDDFQC